MATESMNAPRESTKFSQMESIYTLINCEDETSKTEAQLKKELETGKDSAKIAAMKSVLTQMLKGEALDGVLMHVIRFVMPSKNKQLKKLCILYWEICPKRLANGTPRPEMVLVCNALRSDLLHPNEFIRGQSLRFLTKLKESDILEPLIPSVRENLSHKHPYVRKNAVLAIFTIFKIHKYLIPDAVELLSTYIAQETDQSAKRNVLIMLINSSLPTAVEYYHQVFAQIPNFDQGIQLIFIEMIRKDCKNPTADKAKYIQTIISLLEGTVSAVKYEAANTLIILSSHQSAIKAAVGSYVDLAVKEADNNVKLIVLNRIDDLRVKNDRMLESFVMDILRVVSSPDLLVRKRALEIAMELLSNRNVDEVILFLKKELIKTHDEEYEKTVEYRQLLIHSIHTCAINYPQVADSVVHVLMEFLTDSSKVSAIDVVTFVKEVMERFPHLRTSIIKSLLNAMPDMKAGRTMRGALWIIGEYALESEIIDASMNEIRACIGDLPIVEQEEEAVGVETKSPTVITTQRVLADGTYATETAYSAQVSPTTSTSRLPLRSLVLNGEYYVMTVLSTTLTKLALRFEMLHGLTPETNTFKTIAMLIMTSIIRAGKSSTGSVTSQMDEDSYSRIITCIRVLSSRNESTMVQSFLSDTRQAFGKMIATREKAGKDSGNTFKAQADDVVSFRLLKAKKEDGSNDQDYQDLSRATGSAEEGDVYVNRLDRIFQLTGYSDAIYAEAYITVHQFDILLDVLIINQTKETLQNLTIEFSALGDLKLVEKPAPYTIGPHGYHSVKVNYKVSSTESGIIFGNLVYDTTSHSTYNSVILNDIHVDIMDYIKPKSCNETEFRSMWDEFEWENKINVNTPIKDLKTYLEFVLATTNMKCLTPQKALEGDCGFLAANLYAQSIFGEDALANVCLESNGSSVQGHIRIRSKTQGIALALGEKISTAQKAPKTKVLK